MPRRLLQVALWLLDQVRHAPLQAGKGKITFVPLNIDSHRRDRHNSHHIPDESFSTCRILYHWGGIMQLDRCVASLPPRCGLTLLIAYADRHSQGQQTPDQARAAGRSGRRHQR